MVAATLALLASALAGEAGCSANEGAQTSAAAGASGAAGAAGKAGKAGSAGKAAGRGGAGAAPVQLPALPPQDGIQELVPEPADYSCGPGCLPVFTVSYRTTPISESATTPAGTTDSDGRRVLFSTDKLGEPTFSVGTADCKIAYLSNPSLTPSCVLSIRARIPVPKTAADQKKLLVWDRKTGKVVHQIPLPGIEIPSDWPDSEPIVLSPWQGAASSDDVALFSYVNRIYRITLADGAVKEIAKGLCWSAQLIGREYLCADESVDRFRSVDIETGIVTQLAPGPGRQVEGSCSPDGTRCVWVDYRDPPGLTDAGWFGGEIYLLDRRTHTLRRLTFDSPGTPRLKFRSAVEGDLITWLESSHIMTGPIEARYPDGLDRVVRFDLSQGTRCWFKLTHTSLNSVLGRRLWGIVNDPDNQGDARPVSFDLDSAEIPWTCDPAPPPPVEVPLP